MEADRDAGYRAVHGEREWPSDGNEVPVLLAGLLVGAGGEDGHLVAAASKAGRQVTDVLGDSSRMGEVIRRDQPDLHPATPTPLLPLTDVSRRRRRALPSDPCAPSSARCAGTLVARSGGG